MKAAVTGHVQTQCDTMFRAATDTVQNDLKVLCEAIEAAISDRVQQLFQRISKDYLAVLVGVDSYKANVGPSSMYPYIYP